MKMDQPDSVASEDLPARPDDSDPVGQLQWDMRLMAWLHAENAYQCDVVTWLYAAMMHQVHMAAAKKIAEQLGPELQRQIAERLAKGQPLQTSGGLIAAPPNGNPLFKT